MVVVEVERGGEGGAEGCLGGGVEVELVEQDFLAEGECLPLVELVDAPGETLDQEAD